MRFGIVAFISLLLISCGGRVQRPVALTNSFDDQLTCSHLKAEHQVNQIRLKELIGERHDAVRDNVGFLLVSPLFIDLSDTEKKEAKALTDRDVRIAELEQKRQCPLANKQQTANQKNP